jgi:LysR family transcriptional regulator, low CO2-responsive transcriptional regulator
MRNVTLKQLRALSAIGRTRRIVNAAKELSLTSPAVTLQLQQLEHEAGFPLFDRSADGMRPTDAGRIMLETAGQIIVLLAACGDRLATLKGMTAGRVSVGVVSTAKYFSPKIIAAFAKAHPGIEVSLRVGNRDEIAEFLRDFAIDVAIMGTPPAGLPVEADAIGDHPLIIVAAPGHPLAKRRRLARKELADEVFLTREEGSGTRASMETYLDALPRRAGNRRIEMGSNETIKQAVMAGLGIAFISAHTVAAEVVSRRLIALDVEGLPVRRKWVVVRRGDKALMPAVEAFSEFLKREGAGFLPRYLPSEA